MKVFVESLFACENVPTVRRFRAQICAYACLVNETQSPKTICQRKGKAIPFLKINLKN